MPSSVILKSSDGARIHARAAGDPQNPGMVLTHGLGLSSNVFDEILSESPLLEKYFLVTYDVRGHGRSEIPTSMDSYASKLFADDFAAVCKRFDLRSPIFVGWSLGASILCDICSHLGKNAISSVVYITPVPFLGPLVQEIATEPSLPLLQALLSADSISSYRESRITFVERIFSNSTQVSAPLKWSWLGAAVQQTPEATQFVLSRSQDPSGLWEAGKAGLPLLIILAEDDLLIKNEVIVKTMGLHFVNMKTITISKASHGFFVEKRKELVDALLEFHTPKLRPARPSDTGCGGNGFHTTV